jgi:hypothetical protein
MSTSCNFCLFLLVANRKGKLYRVEWLDRPYPPPPRGIYRSSAALPKGKNWTRLLSCLHTLSRHFIFTTSKPLPCLLRASCCSVIQSKTSCMCLLALATMALWPAQRYRGLARRLGDSNPNTFITGSFHRGYWPPQQLHLLDIICARLNMIVKGTTPCYTR